MTTLTQTRIGSATTVRATSDLTGDVWYFWYQDGVYLRRTTGNTQTFIVQPGEQSIVDCIDSNTPDPVPAAPAQYPAWRSLSFIRSASPAISKYRVEQQENGGSWTTVATIQDRAGQWVYTVDTARLDDLAAYSWRVIPIDTAGNEGSPVGIGGEAIVRTPDAPSYSCSFSDGKVTFA